MAANRSWMAIAWLLSIAALSACATSGSDTTGAGGSDPAASSSAKSGAGGQGGTGGAGGAGGAGGGGPVTPACGDGQVATVESCDDGNTLDADGCSGACELEQGWSCAGAPSKCSPKCGDGLVVGDEGCDDGNAKKGDGCSLKCSVEDGWNCDAASPSKCDAVCGDGIISDAEQCDDGDVNSNDGCSDACLVEPGYSCLGAPSACSSICGDGFLAANEDCDDDNLAPGDGCTEECKVEDFWACTGSPSACVTPCGDGLQFGLETCDDGNTDVGDGCDATCTLETGWSCSGEPSDCATICGDGHIIGPEKCDDGNSKGNDGCNVNCKVEPGWTCSVASPSACATICGDGLPVGPEGCDDGNSQNNDGCAVTCQPETGYTCSNSPSNCITVCGDGVAGGLEKCDDGNSVNGDGCTTGCAVEQGWTCVNTTGVGTVCTGICGDGLVVSAEPCDDGNLVDNDCCSSTCQAEPSCEIEGNNSISDANDFDTLSLGGLIQGSIKPAGESDFYSIVLPPDTTLALIAETLNGTTPNCFTQDQDSTLNLYDPTGKKLATDDESGTGHCALLVAGGLQGGPDGSEYYVEVKGSTAGASFSYSLQITTQVTICGDGILVLGEQCDDGNTADGDGCSSVCLYEIYSEIEPNNTAAQATVNGPFPLNSIWSGAVPTAGDVDIYQINVAKTVDLRIETFDGNGPGTCVAIDTKIELLGPNGTQSLATDDEDGLNSCSLISAVNDAGARHLYPGTYFVKVQHFSSTQLIAAYRVEVKPTALCGNGIKEGFEQCDSTPECDANCDLLPNCGDGVISTGEQCDDGNTASGDGCSSSCLYENSEIEPNNTAAQATANGPFPLNTLWFGAIAVAGDIDIYQINVAKTADLSIETFDGNGPGSCVAIDPKIELLGPNGTTSLATDDQDGLNSCALINATNDAGARHLYPGTYFVKVQHFSSTQLIPAYRVEAKTTALCGNGTKEGFEPCDGTPNCDANCDLIPFCGDGIVIGTETCDDGNTVDGDGCSSTCQLEGLLFEIEPNNTLAQADVLPVVSGDALITGGIGPIGDKDTFKLNVAALSVVRFETFEGVSPNCPAITTTLRLFDSTGTQTLIDTPSGTTASGINNCAALVARLPPGAYYVQVEETGNNAAIPSYLLEIKFENGLGTEVEPNDTQAQSNPLSGTDVFVTGDHQNAAEFDFFAITIPAGKSIRAEILEGDAVETCESNGVDSTLVLFNATGTALVTDGDDGRGFCSTIDGTGATPRDAGAHNLAAGTYFLQVKGFSTTGVNSQFNYSLAVTVR